MNENVREAVEQLNGENAKPPLKGTEPGRAVVDQIDPLTIANGHFQSLPPSEPPTIHYSELPDGRADSPNAKEWNLYRREVGRLLGDGHENKWVLIKGEEIIGIWDTEKEARAVALAKYLMKPCLIHQIRSREPVLRAQTRLWLCRN